MTSCTGSLISMFGTRMCGQTLLFIVIVNGAITRAAGAVARRFVLCNLVNIKLSLYSSVKAIMISMTDDRQDQPVRLSSLGQNVDDDVMQAWQLVGMATDALILLSSIVTSCNSDVKLLTLPIKSHTHTHTPF